MTARQVLRSLLSDGLSKEELLDELGTMRKQLDAQAKRIAELEGVEAQLLTAESMVKNWEGQLQAYEKGHDEAMATFAELLWPNAPVPTELDEATELTAPEQWLFVTNRVRDLAAAFARNSGLLDLANGVAKERAELILAQEAELAKQRDEAVQLRHQLNLAEALLKRSVLRKPLDELLEKWRTGPGEAVTLDYCADELEAAIKRADDPRTPLHGSGPT